MKKVLFSLLLVVGLVSNVFGNEPVRTRKSLVEVSTEVSIEDVVLQITEVVLEEIQEEVDFELLLPTLKVTEVVLEDIVEEDFVVLQSKCDKCNKCNK